MQVAPLQRSSLPEARVLLEQSCAFDSAAQVADELLFGEGVSAAALPLGAFSGDTIVGVACVSAAWIRLLAVNPAQRGKGVGTALLRACEERVAGPTAKVMDQPGNYLSPGVDSRNLETLAWLQRRGYQRIGSACNLRIALSNNPRVTSEALSTRVSKVATLGYSIVRLPEARIDEAVAWALEHFSAGWAFELRKATLNTAKTRVHVACDSRGSFVGFSVHDGNNQGLGWFGPTGTLPEHRGKGLGATLLIASLLDIQADHAHAHAHAHAEVAWTGPRDFYDKIAGVDSERHFVRLSKEL